MSEELARPIRWEWRYVAGMLSIGFFCYVICYVIWWGKADNGLHSSALSWSFMCMLAVLVGMGVAASIPDILKLMGKSQ